RGHAFDYDHWAQLGLKGWSYEEVLPYFKKMETSWRGEGRYHGGSGPLTVSRNPTDPNIYPKLIAAAEKLGFKHLDDFHAEEAEGFTAPEFTVHRGRRASTSQRYLHPV